MAKGTTVWVDEEVKWRLKERATLERISVKDLIARVLAYYLARVEEPTQSDPVVDGGHDDPTQ